MIMAKITVTATRVIERTTTVEINVRIGDVKDWMKDEFGSPSEHGLNWNDPEVLEQYIQSNAHLIDEVDGDNDDINDDWEIQTAEEA